MVSGTAQARAKAQILVPAAGSAGFFIWVITAVLCWPGLNAAAQTADLTPCHAPADLIDFGAGLPRLAEAVAKGGPIRIVALGSSSTEGAGASTKEACYPARLEAELRLRFPGTPVEVHNLGIGGQLASDMSARIEAEVVALKPQLVIWQTGVNDALRGVDLDTFRSVVMDGLMLLRAAGADVVLLDPQFYPGSARVPAYSDFVSVLDEISQARQVPILRRYKIMQHLVTSAQYTIDDLLAADGFHQNDEGYRCLGTLMADAIEASVRTGDGDRGMTEASAAAMPGATSVSEKN